MICGIPYITLKGTPKDWQKIADNVKEFRQFDLDCQLIYRNILYKMSTQSICKYYFKSICGWFIIYIFAFELRIFKEYPQWYFRFSKNIRKRFIYTAIPETLFPLVSAEITDYDLNRAIQNGTIPSFLACLFSKESRDEIKSIEWDSDTILGFVCLFALGGLAIWGIIELELIPAAFKLLEILFL